jgi:hypothetical protein
MARDKPIQDARATQAMGAQVLLLRTRNRARRERDCAGERETAICGTRSACYGGTEKEGTKEMKPKMQTKTCAWREWIHGQLHNNTYWVSDLPGHGGKDWGYTLDSRKAIHLSPYWQRRFAADMRRVGYEARFVECLA